MNGGGTAAGKAPVMVRAMHPAGDQLEDRNLVADLDHLPEVLTVEEAGAVLRISRTLAYQQARRWRDSNGQEGLPVVVLGRSLRVPRAALRRLLTVDRPLAP